MRGDWEGKDEETKPNGSTKHRSLIEYKLIRFKKLLISKKNIMKRFKIYVETKEGNHECVVSKHELMILMDCLIEIQIWDNLTKERMLKIVNVNPGESLCVSKQFDEIHQYSIKITRLSDDNSNSKKKSVMSNMYVINFGGNALDKRVPEEIILKFQKVLENEFYFSKAMDLIKMAVPIVWQSDPVNAIAEIDNIYKQISTFPILKHKRFIYRFDDQPESLNYISIRRVA